VERANFNLKIKSIEPDGSFVGMGAVFNNVDLGKDRILPGAFDRTLQAGKQWPLLWQHDPENPIGTFTAAATQQGLQISGQLLLSDATGAKAYNLLKNNVIRGLSIGYDTVKSAFVDDVRELQELKLWECSIVTFPMNESAMVTGIKAMSDSDRGEHLKQINIHRKAIDRHQRGIREHLKSLSDAFDDDPEDEALLLDEGADEEDLTKAFLVELQKLAEQAQELA
jgi:HK97 family phage prohead protease